MKRALQCGALLTITAFICGAHLWGASGAATTIAQQKQTSERNSPHSSAQLEHAQTIFTENCARCHGADGRALTALGKEVEATNLTDAEWQKRASDKRIMRSIMRGRGRRMPAFGKKLSPDDVMALCALVRTLKK
jgi:cbb3-type cytochrome c oxidase subunit III